MVKLPISHTISTKMVQPTDHRAKSYTQTQSTINSYFEHVGKIF
jgi:hypothetical protein